MKPTKEMIEAVKYMAVRGKCNSGYDICIVCPIEKYCDATKWSEVDKTLQTSAKNWLKENGIKLYLDPENPGALTRIPNEFGSVGEIKK
jgi:hypothetical protein